MSTKENKELILRAFNEWSEVAGDTAKVRSVYDKYYASDLILHHVDSSNSNREQGIQSDIALVSAFPDAKFSIDDVVAEGDKVVTRGTMKGTHKGTFLGIPATGKQIVLRAIEIDKIVRGKVSEAWVIMDTLGLMTQLGAIPAPKK